MCVPLGECVARRESLNFLSTSPDAAAIRIRRYKDMSRRSASQTDFRRKPLITQRGLDGEADIAVRGNALVGSPATHARAQWTEAFRAMAQQDDNRLLDEPQPTRWDEDERQWR